MTLVELIVVLAIVAIITALAVPGVARLGAFSGDEVPRAAREVFQMLRAARIYAATYNVPTAVVYSLDNWTAPQARFGVNNNQPVNPPIPGNEITLDSITGQPVRYIRAAAIMYALPGSEERFLTELGEIVPFDEREEADAFVPVPGSEGQWKALDEDVAVLFNDPDSFQPVYQSPLARYSVDADGINGTPSLGMFMGAPVILDYDRLAELSDPANPGSLLERLAQFDRFPAHIFGPDGRLRPTAGGQPLERYTFLVGPRPDQPLEVRLINSNLEDPIFTADNGDQLYFVDNQGNLNFRAVPIEIQRSTGRVKIAS